MQRALHPSDVRGRVVTGKVYAAFRWCCVGPKLGHLSWLVPGRRSTRPPIFLPTLGNTAFKVLFNCWIEPRDLVSYVLNSLFLAQSNDSPRIWSSGVTLKNSTRTRLSSCGVKHPT